VLFFRFVHMSYKVIAIVRAIIFKETYYAYNNAFFANVGVSVITDHILAPCRNIL